MDEAAGVSGQRQKCHSAGAQFTQIEQPSRYVRSRFTAYGSTADGNTLLVYNSLTGRKCAIPAPGAGLARKILGPGGTRGPLSPIGDYLVREGYMICEGVDEGAILDLRAGRQQHRTDVLQLMLLCSEECNFRCVYCSQEFNRDLMEPWVRSAIRKLVEKRIEGCKLFNISWFGGEPLLGYEVIEELAPFFRDLALEHGVHYTSDMTTNGFLLSSERFTRLVDWGIRSFQITIDGGVVEHDAHRPLKGGGPTFNTVLQNVLATRDAATDFSIIIRANVDRSNANRLGPLLEELGSRLAGDSRYKVHFHPVGKWGGPNDASLDVCGMREARESETRLAAEARKSGLRPEDASERLLPIPSNICYAARPYHLIVGADGKLMKCSQVLDTMDSNVVGRILPSGELEIIEDRFSLWVRPYYQTDGACHQCFFVPVCQGSICPLVRIRDARRPCPPDRLMIHQTLERVWADGERAGARRVLVSNARGAAKSKTDLKGG